MTHAPRSFAVLPCIALAVITATSSCKDDEPAASDDGTSETTAGNADTTGGLPDGETRDVVRADAPLVLENPIVEPIGWPLWGGSFAIDAPAAVHVAMTAAAGTEDGIVLGVPGEEAVGRGVALLRVGDVWQLQERDGDAVGTTVEIDAPATATFDITVAELGSAVEVTAIGGGSEMLALDPPLVDAGGTIGTYVRIGAESTLELAELTLTEAAVPDDGLGTPLRELAAAKGITIGTATDVWPPLHDVGFERMLGAEFDLAAPSEFYWTTTRSEGPDVFYFVPADTMVNYALVHDQRVRGYHLVWDLELPQWLLDITDTGDAVATEDALRNHVQTIVGRYRGKVQEWVVVNEAIWGPEVTGDPNVAEWAESVWTDVLGPEYIETSFRAARDADPDAILLYNETGAESLGAKSDFMYDMVADFVARGVPIDGVGLQFHVDAAARPDPGDLAANMQRFADLGVDVYITELDVNLIALTGTTDEKLAIQAEIFVDVLDACLSVPGCKSYTMWGFTDRYAWYDREEGAEAPLLVDEAYTPKPAFWAVQQRLSE